MERWNRVGVALVAIILAGCATRETGEMTPPPPPDEAAVRSQREASMASAMAAVAAKEAWRNRYFEGSTVNGAWVHDSDLLVSTFDPAARTYDLHCFDVQRGLSRWMVKLGTSPLRYPPGAGERLVVAVLERGGAVVINRRTGAREYRMTVPLNVIAAGSAGSSDTTLYVPSLTDNRVHAVNPDNGLSAWHWRAEGTMIGGPVVTPRIPRRLVCVGTDEGEVAALPANGWDEAPPKGPSWSRRLLGDVTAEMTIATVDAATGRDVMLIVPCEDRGLYCLDASSGDTKWVLRTSSAFRDKAQVAGGLVFARNQERLCVADLATGGWAWKPSDDGAAPKPFEGAQGIFAADGKRVYLDCGSKRVCRADAKTGEILASASLDAFDMIVPTGDNNLLLGITRDGYLVAWH